MRPVLLVSIALATVAVGAAAYPFLSPRGGAKAGGAAPVVTADASPVRLIPLYDGSAPRPKRVEAASADGRGGWVDPAAKEPAKETAKAAPPEPAPEARAESKPDVLASVGQTLAGMREAAPTPGAALSPGQEEALRKVAARRKVRPVTKTSFPLEVGANVPSAVYLHPVPPEVASLAPGGLGFALVGARTVVVSVDSRQVVAVGGN